MNEWKNSRADTVVIPFYKRGNWGLQRWSNLPMVKSTASIKSQALKALFPWCWAIYVNLTFSHLIRKDFLYEKDHDLKVNKWYIPWMCLSVIFLELSSPSQTLLRIQITWESYECRFWFSRWVNPGVGPKMYITNKLPSEATATERFELVRG